MRTVIRRCGNCCRYSMRPTCPECGSDTRYPAPLRYSPEDRYGEYRRKSIIEEYGENGKHCDL
ncbi:MAG: RNA-protein complex protein Nop10 [Candidatus Thermoplasmatota archaeon]|nr:RNA-protein complex protein Nop10 [Candidatus Thermoplasmatota archaeon]